MRVFYSSRYEFPLPRHVWPTAKYRLVADALRGTAGVEFVEPSPVSWDDLALVHAREYLDRLRYDRLTREDIATLELPWRAGLADGFRLMVGGTCDTVRAALADGVAAHIGGGLHHAFAAHGEGFCPLNDIAVAIRLAQRGFPSHAEAPLQREVPRIGRAAVIDLDVHHGNGTAMLFEQDATVFTCSIHQQHNYPVFKPRGNLDIGLDNRASDAAYLHALDRAFPAVMDSRPELVIYVAGADPYEQDKLGGLSVTKAGLAERDRRVIETVRAAGVPLATVLAGGYAFDVQDTVDIHAATIRALVSSG